MQLGQLCCDEDPGRGLCRLFLRERKNGLSLSLVLKGSYSVQVAGEDLRKMGADSEKGGLSSVVESMSSLLWIECLLVSP